MGNKCRALCVSAWNSAPSLTGEVLKSSTKADSVKKGGNVCIPGALLCRLGTLLGLCIPPMLVTHGPEVCLGAC